MIHHDNNIIQSCWKNKKKYVYINDYHNNSRTKSVCIFRFLLTRMHVYNYNKIMQKRSAIWF